MSRMLLAVPALLPILGGVVLLIMNHFKGNAVFRYRRLALLVEGITLVNSLVIGWLIVHKAGTGEQMVLFKLYGDLRVMFSLDGLGSVFAGLIAFLWPLAVLYSFEYMRNEERQTVFFSYYLMTYGVTVGIAFAGNLVTLYLFYELLTLVTFPLVLHPMTKAAVRASRKYLYYAIGGAAFAFIGIIFVLNFSTTGNTQFIPGGNHGCRGGPGAEADASVCVCAGIFRFWRKGSAVSLPWMAAGRHGRAHAGHGPAPCRGSGEVRRICSDAPDLL